VDIEPLDEAPDDGADVLIGGDIGLSRDASAFVAIHRRGSELVMADCLELRPKKGQPLKLEHVVKAGCEFAARHGQRTIHLDDHVLGPARDHLPDGFELERVAGGAKAKFERHARLRTELRAGNVKIPKAFVRLVRQLGLVVAKPVAGGTFNISMPRRGGSHGDLCAAFVLAVDAAVEDAGDARNEKLARELRAMAPPRKHVTGYADLPGVAPLDGTPGARMYSDGYRVIYGVPKNAGSALDDALGARRIKFGPSYGRYGAF
jgi:hypothetical protein